MLLTLTIEIHCVGLTVKVCLNLYAVVELAFGGLYHCEAYDPHFSCFDDLGIVIYQNTGATWVYLSNDDIAPSCVLYLIHSRCFSLHLHCPHI